MEIEHQRPQEPAEPEAEGEASPQFEVSRKVFKVFSTLFAAPSQSDHVGEVPWTEFLHAMAAVGLAPEKLYGSVWHFTPVAGCLERSIQFHEPHPHNKLPYWTARRIGRRLDRAYGWTIDDFAQR